jgi:hypothetical protein
MYSILLLCSEVAHMFSEHTKSIIRLATYAQLDYLRETNPARKARLRRKFEGYKAQLARFDRAMMDSGSAQIAHNEAVNAGSACDIRRTSENLTWADQQLEVHTRDM